MEHTYLEKAKILRTDPTVHYNCAQAVTVTFAEKCGLTPAQANALAAHFGSGMKMGETCGAITGGLMVIGLLGGSDLEYRAFMDGMKAKHNRMTRCVDLLKNEVTPELPKAQHCDQMVYEAVELVIEIMHL